MKYGDQVSLQNDSIEQHLLKCKLILARAKVFKKLFNYFN